MGQQLLFFLIWLNIVKRRGLIKGNGNGGGHISEMGEYSTVAKESSNADDCCNG